jgi:uncharacterized phage-associated protein
LIDILGRREVEMTMSDSGYNARKAGQVAAFFAMNEGHPINVVKLIKLIYLADRAFMNSYDEPMLMDRFVSMRHGPVNSRTYECLNEGAEGWDEFIADRENHTVWLTNAAVTEDDLDELSEADLDTLKDTWKALGHFNQWELVKYTHDNCPEWEDPEGSSSPIPYARIFKFLGKARPYDLEKEVMESKRIAFILSPMK